MKIKKIKVENFLSFNEFEIDFTNKGLCLLEGYNYDEGGSNGSGKSSIFNAVIFSLFGDLPKKLKVDEVINDAAGKGCKVDIELGDGINNYLISRGRKPNFLNFYVNGEKISDIDATQTQKLIEKRLGLNFDIFINSVYFPQNSVNFLSLNDGQKKSVLTDIINLNIFESALKLVKLDLKKVEFNYHTIVASKNNLVSNLSSIRNDIDVYKKKLNNFEIERSQKKQSMMTEVLKIEEIIKSKEKDLTLLQSMSISNEEKKNKLDEEKSKKTEAILTIENEIDKVNRQKNLVETQINLIKAKNSRYQNISKGHCSNCFQEVSDLQYLDVLRQQDNLQIAKLEDELNSLNEQFNKLPTRAKLSKIREDIEIAIGDIKLIISTNLNDVQKNRDIIESSKERLNSLLKHVADENDVFNPYIEILENLEKSSKESELKIQECIKNEQSLKASLDSLETLKEAFGSNGIRSYVFDAILNELNFRSNEYLGKLFEGDVRILFQSRDGSDSESKQGFTTQILVDGNPVGMGKFSGGEERRLIFAVNLAIADTMANRASNNFNIMFLDEAFDGLDFEGKRKCMDLLLDLSEKKDSIMMIDHGNEFKTLFNNVLRVEKKNKISSIA